MRITVIGSTSRIGRHLLAEAHRRRHEIVAFTRRPDALTDHEKLAAIVKGDGRDDTAVRTAIDGSDAVISIVNGGNRHDPRQAAQVAQTVTTAMTALKVRRLVVTSAYPLVAQRPRLQLWLLRRLLAVPYADSAEMERIVSASNLDWTIVRLNRLTDKPPTGAVITSPSLLTAPRPTTRADVAAALLDITENTTNAQTALNIAPR